MKIKSLAGLINKSKTLVLYSPDEEHSAPQWAGDGSALYSLAGLPKMTTAHILRAMDVPDNKAADIDAQAKPLPTAFLPYMRELSDTTGMREIIPGDETFTYKGYVLCPFTTRDNACYLIQTKYIKPLDNIDKLSFWLASPSAARFIVAYDGLFPVAILLPMHDSQGNITRYLSALATKLKYTSPWNNSPEETEGGDEHGQADF